MEKQTESDARHTMAAEETRMKEDNTAAETTMRRAERAAEIER